MIKKVNSYAKINLCLKVIKKTKSGYHKLEMITQLIDLCDLISFFESEEIIVEMNKQICLMEENLCYKVAKYLRDTYKVKKGIKIYIEKNIPNCAGLGGGSSNAAEVIRFLNDYWNLNLSKKEMKKIGFMFGCDIPYFIEAKPSVVRGFGEKIRPIDIKNTPGDIVLLVPSFSLSTKDVYNCCDISKIVKSNSVRKIFKRGIIDYTLLFNDLTEPANIVSKGKINHVIDALNNLGLNDYVMTGSGSTFVIFGAVDKIKNIEESLPASKCFVCSLIK